MEQRDEKLTKFGYQKTRACPNQRPYVVFGIDNASTNAKGGLGRRSEFIRQAKKMMQSAIKLDDR